jgi:hypothetical protein
MVCASEHVHVAADPHSWQEVGHQTKDWSVVSIQYTDLAWLTREDSAS